GAQLVRLGKVGRIDKGHVEDGHGAVERSQEGRRRNRALDDAELYAFVHLARLAELSGREELELHRAIGPFLHQVGNHLQALMPGLLRRFKMTDARRELLCLRDASGENRRDCKTENAIPCHFAIPLWFREVEEPAQMHLSSEISKMRRRQPYRIA